MKIRHTHLGQVIRAQTFLGSRRAGEPRDIPHELRLELLHPCRREKNGRIILGDQGITGHDLVAFGFEEL